MASERDKRFGGYNELPPNWKPCKPSDFWYRFFNFRPEREEFRQPFINGKAESVNLYFYSLGEGLAMVQKYNMDTGEYYPELYKFALCEHEWVHTGTPFNCYNTYTCKKCGQQDAVDSSG